MGADKGLERMDDTDPLSLPFPGRRIWKWCWSGGLAVVSVSVVVSLFISWGSVTDAPNHDYLLSAPILAGVVLMTTGAILFPLSGISGKGIAGEAVGGPRTTIILAAFTVIVSVFLLNPLISPVAFLRDSDLDSAQDYNDAFPYDHSRIDHPWVWFTAVYAHSSHTATGWNVTIGSGVNSCWLEETGIKVLNPDNTTALEPTLLQDLGYGAVNGVRYLNLDKADRMDEGDYFLLDAATFADGSRFQIWANTHGWQVLQMAVL